MSGKQAPQKSQAEEGVVSFFSAQERTECAPFVAASQIETPRETVGQVVLSQSGTQVLSGKRGGRQSGSCQALVGLTNLGEASPAR